jgi:8-oxo-dGTP pyrophosphatase MutT (NUDIX family)
LNGQLEVLLVTSRETRRWVIPKGWPMRDLADHLAAAEEAWEEAGVKGSLDDTVLGTFTYDKRRRSEVIPLEVTVYLMTVVEVFDKWPEAHERDRAWFSVPDAAEAIAEPELRAIILSLAKK